MAGCVIGMSSAYLDTTGENCLEFRTFAKSMRRGRGLWWTDGVGKSTNKRLKRRRFWQGRKADVVLGRGADARVSPIGNRGLTPFQPRSSQEGELRFPLPTVNPSLTVNARSWRIQALFCAGLRMGMALVQALPSQ